MDSSAKERIAYADRKQVRMFAMIGAVALLLFATFMPTGPAHAGIFDQGMFDGIGKIILIPLYNGMCEICDSFYDGIISGANIIGTLKTVDGFSNIMKPVYDFLETAQESVISVIAKQILTLAFMFRLLTITKVAESNDMSPIAPKVAMSCIGYFLMIYLVDNAMGLFTVGFQLAQDMLTHMSSSTTEFMEWKVANQDVFDKVTTANLLMIILFGMVLQVVASFIAFIFVMFLYYGRILILYIQAFFSPIAIAMLGVDSTRQWGLGFIRNVASTLLSLVIMYFILMVFPSVQAAVMGGMGAVDLSGGQTIGEYLILSSVNGSGIGETIFYIMPLIVVDLLLVFLVVKASSLAKEILGS